MKPLEISTLKGWLRRPIIVALTPLFVLVMVLQAILLFVIKTAAGMLAVPFIYGKQVGCDLRGCVAMLMHSVKEVW